MQAFYTEAISISEQNVEIVRRAWEAFARRDNESALRLYDADVELHGGLDGSVTYRGVRGVREFFRDWLDAWDEWGSEVEEWIDAGDSVIAMMHTHGRGKQSGVPVDRREAHVWTLRERKLWRLQIFETKAEALKAVGLAE